MAGNLDPITLNAILTKFAPGVDFAEDGVFATPWLSTETFYRMTEGYVVLEKRAAYRAELERAFPNKKSVF